MLAELNKKIILFTNPPTQVFEPLTNKGPPLVKFSEIRFGPTNPEIFLKALLAPIYTNFEEDRAPKKTQIYWSKFSKKCPKTAFYLFFYQLKIGWSSNIRFFLA